MDIVSQSKGSQTAASIRAQAERLFAAHGYAAVSMRQIADAVGMRVGGLYNHFPTKQDILRELMVRHLQDLLAAWAASDPTASTAGDRLTAFARFHIRFHFEKPDAVFVAYMELRNLSPANFDTVEALRRSYEERLRAILDAGAAEFSVEDRAVAARALIAMLTGVTTWYRPGGRLSIEAVETIYVNMARRSVGLDPVAERRPNDAGGNHHVRRRAEIRTF